MMVVVLMVRPAGLFGQNNEGSAMNCRKSPSPSPVLRGPVGLLRCRCALVVYPIFLMKLLCFALFACAFNLLLGYTGLLSFGHAAFFGGAAYITRLRGQGLGFPPELGILVGTAVAALLGLRVRAPGHPARRASTSR